MLKGLIVHRHIPCKKCDVEKLKQIKLKKNRKFKQHVSLLIGQWSAVKHVNILFRHQAHNRTKHTQPKKKERLRVKSKKQNVSVTFWGKKKGQECKKIKEREKNWEEKGVTCCFPLSCKFQFGTGRKKKIPSSSVRSLSPKSSEFFFVRGPIRTKKEKMEENKMTKNTQAVFFLFLKR